MRRITVNERHASTTALNVSVAFKLTICRFTNSSLLLVILHSHTAETWFDGGQLVYEATVLILLMALTNPIIYVIDPAGLFKKVKKYIEMQKGDECQLTQREDNVLCEGTTLDVANNISAYFSMIMTCIFFSPIIPIAIPIALVGSWLHYIAYKYMMLRRHKQPDMLSRTIGTFFANFMPYVALIWACGFIIFVDALNTAYNPDN